MVRQNRLEDATRLMLAAAPETMALQDTDEWWRQRRVLARKLLDQGKFQNAYQVVRDAAPPANEYYRADSHFMPGWIALRYLNDPATARAHFAHIDDGATNPIVLARANYWRGRAAEAIGENDQMRASYEAAAGYPTAYYGQLARAKLGLDKIELRLPLQPDPVNVPPALDELVRAADMLYTLGERDVVLYFVTDLAEQSVDVAALVALGELTARRCKKVQGSTKKVGGVWLGSVRGAPGRQPAPQHQNSVRSRRWPRGHCDHSRTADIDHITVAGSS